MKDIQQISAIHHLTFFLFNQLRKMKIKEIKLEIGQKMKDIQIMKNKENERYPSCTENDKMIDIQLEEDRK